MLSDLNLVRGSSFKVKKLIKKTAPDSTPLQLILQFTTWQDGTRLMSIYTGRNAQVVFVVVA